MLAASKSAEIDRAIKTWRDYVQSMIELRDETRKAVDAARRMYRKAGITIKPCREVPWGPGI